MAKAINGVCVADHVTREDWLAAMGQLKDDPLSTRQYQHGVTIDGKTYPVKRLRLYLENEVRARLGLPRVTPAQVTGGMESVRVVLACSARCRQEGDPPVEIGKVSPLIQRSARRQPATKRTRQPPPLMGTVLAGEPDAILPSLPPAAANGDRTHGLVQYRPIDPNLRYANIHQRFGFAAGTQVLLRDEHPRDTCPVEALAGGQEVVAVRVGEWITRPRSVLEHTTWDVPDDGEMREVEVASYFGLEDDGPRTIVVAPHQPFLVYNHGYDYGWEPAFALQPNDRVLRLRADAFYAYKVTANRVLRRGEGGVTQIHRVIVEEPYVLVANGFVVADGHHNPVVWMAPAGPSSDTLQETA